ncbi:TPA: hypothetical protein OVR50_000877 [Staphylococcus aureus]|uniref:virulence-associated E family protein n=1 Tax=Staphylococcus aureus TaxID=1280 RepID=UPI000EE4181B|nr:virulence-associated E family protein [Staphylococcus aureus]GBZ47920.1 virulence-associated E family protein [Staphylococcus aureus]HCV1870844.1 hypothetical protein [Staphylococcus aureus]HCV2755933.1 hypothetical protein [Staphylococcus aureus]HCY8707254.1 hypothetical protein [Staphylococcus aureus]HDX1775399.1 hypothetical protein [Staphylococcus aureus]
MLDKVTQIETIKYDRDVSYSYAASRLSTHWTNHNMAWSDFMQKLAQTVRTKEDLTEYNKMSKSEQADIKDVGGFVGGYLKEGKRRAGQVMNRSMLTLDIDYAAQDMTDILSMFYDFAYCLYSTHKHREISPRLRLVIPLKRNVNADEYEAIGRKVADIVGMDYFDDTTYQPHRLMYWPSTSNDAEFFFTYEDLPLLDPDKILNEYVDWTDTLEWPTSSREESKTKRLADKQGDPEEKPGIVGAFCRAYTIEEAIETFIPDLYEKHSTNRYTYHEGSTAGGLVLYENNKFAYSHHNTDPVSGMLVNSFDLVRIHLYGAQGVGKSALLKKLGGAWFSDSLVSVTGKEAYEALQGVWLMEMAELAATRKAEVEAIKHFISKQVDRFRVAYGHYIEDFPRQCIFIGTTNKVDFLRDETGGRRFWPMTVNPERVEVNWSKLTKEEIDQIWAEAKYYYEQGEELFLNPELEEEMRSIQSKHTEESPYTGIIDEYLNTPIPSNWEDLSIFERRRFYQGDVDMLPTGNVDYVERNKVCALEVFVECFGKDKGDSRGSMEIRKISNILRQLDNWSVYDGNKSGKIRFGKDYGVQIAYVRDESLEDLI